MATSKGAFWALGIVVTVLISAVVLAGISLAQSDLSLTRALSGLSDLSSVAAPSESEEEEATEAEFDDAPSTESDASAPVAAQETPSSALTLPDGTPAAVPPPGNLVLPTEATAVEPGQESEVAQGAAEPVPERLDRTAITGVIRGRMPAIRLCYERGLAENPGNEGSVVVRVHIDPAGTVAGVQLQRSTVGDPGVEACVLSQFKRLRFPASKQPTTITYPIRFSKD